MENRFRGWYGPDAPRPMILAHRGDSSRAPENTIESARLGHSAGADGWELDVRLTRDGVPVVLHDESLLRTTDVARRFEGDPRAEAGYLIGGFTLEEVRTLDAGSWFLDPSGGPRSAAGFGTFERLGDADRAHYASGAVRIPTLAEALALTVQLDWMVNVEIKPTSGDVVFAVSAVLEAVREAGAVGVVAVSSFDPKAVALAASVGSGLATGLLVAEPPDRPAVQLLGELKADALHAPADVFSWPVGLRPSPARASAGRRDVPILVYTVNDPGPGGLADRLAGSGASGVFTDDPASLALRWIGR